MNGPVSVIVFETQFIEPSAVILRDNGRCKQNDNSTALITMVIPGITPPSQFAHVEKVVGICVVGNDPYAGYSIESLGLLEDSVSVEFEQALAGADADAGAEVVVSVPLLAAGKTHTVYMYTFGS